MTGLVGLAISYVLSMTGLLNGVVTYFTETEKQMVSVERIDQYISDVPQEHHTENIQVLPIAYHRYYVLPGTDQYCVSPITGTVLPVIGLVLPLFLLMCEYWKSVT